MFLLILFAYITIVNCNEKTLLTNFIIDDKTVTLSTNNSDEIDHKGKFTTYVFIQIYILVSNLAQSHVDRTIAVCFDNLSNSSSPLQLFYCILYLISSAFITGLGFYFYFKRIINHMRREYHRQQENQKEMYTVT